MSRLAEARSAKAGRPEPPSHVSTSHVSTSHVARRMSHVFWLWIVVIVAFFSLSHDKQDLYVLPIVPAVAALGAGAIGRR